MDLNIDSFFQAPEELPPGGDAGDAYDDVSELMKSWICERTAPEILPCQTSLLDRMMERVQRQISPETRLLTLIK